MPIEIKNLTHKYMPGSANERLALFDVSLTVEEGSFLGIIGHTGSGKSTLMQLMIGIMTPTSGEVYIDGLNLADKKQRLEARKLTGMAFQYPEYQLFEETVARDVAFGPRNMSVSEEEIPERVEQALTLCGLSPDVFSLKSPFDLSGGEKRRAALAGILAINPKYILLDEPMAGLDPQGRRDIISMLMRMREKTGMAVVMISHFMDDVADCAEKIAVLNKGRLELYGDPSYVFSHAQKLIDMGLDVPQAAGLVPELRKRGMDIPDGIYKKQQLVQYLKALYLKEEAGAND